MNEAGQGQAIGLALACTLSSYRRVSSTPSVSMRSLRTSSSTVTSSVTVSLSSRTRSTGTVSFSTTGRSSWRVTSCSSSLMSGPDRARPGWRP